MNPCIRFEFHVNQSQFNPDKKNNNTFIDKLKKRYEIHESSIVSNYLEYKKQLIIDKNIIIM